MRASRPAGDRFARCRIRGTAGGRTGSAKAVVRLRINAQFGKHLAGDAEALDSGGHATIDGDLHQGVPQCRQGNAVAQGPSEVQLELVHASGRMHEFELHFRGALRNGVTLAALRDTLMQIAVYCGMPAGVESFRVARKVFAELGIDPETDDSLG